MFCLVPRRPHPYVGLFLCQEEDRHCLLVDRFHEIVGIRGQKTIEIVGREPVPNLPDALPLRHMDAGEEGRIAMGGRGIPYRFGSGTDSQGKTQEATIAQLRAILTRLLPQTKNLRIDHSWCGVLGVPRDWSVLSRRPGGGPEQTSRSLLATPGGFRGDGRLPCRRASSSR